MEKNRLPWYRCAVAGGWDGIKSDDGTILFNVSANNEANSDFLVTACNAHATLKADSKTLDWLKDSIKALDRQARGNQTSANEIVWTVTGALLKNTEKYEELSK
jgi:hypothetical protein